MKTFHSLAVAALTLAPLSACDEYNPPPKISMIQPANGFWIESMPIELRFSESIKPESLIFDIRPRIFDREGDFPADVPPILEGCRATQSTCGDLSLALSEGNTRLTITQNDAFKEYEGRPLILVVRGGIQDLDGRTGKLDKLFSFQVNPSATGEPIDIELETGVMTLAASLEPIGLPVWLRLVVDFAFDRENGRFKAIGTYGQHIQQTPQLPPNYAHPDGFQPVLDANNWAITFDGTVVKQREGQYFFESKPFDVSIVLFNTIPITLSGFRVQGTFEPGNNVDGRDYASGTLSTSGGSFGSPPTSLDAITTSWEGIGFHANEIAAGLPRVCSEDPCAAVRPVGGDCQVPSPWDPSDYCE